MQDLRAYLQRVRAHLWNGSAEVLSPAAAYDRWAPSYRSRMNPLQEMEDDALRRLLPDVSGRTVLDVGCGTGRVSRMALERGAASIVGVDISPAMIEEARSRSDPSIRWVHADVGSLPFEASTFDVLTCSLVLGHVDGLEDALTEMNRVLKAGGQVVISDFHPFATLRGWDRTFRDRLSGRTYAIVQHLHLFDQYFRCFRERGWRIEAFEEPLYARYPVAFVLRARKETSR